MSTLDEVKLMQQQGVQEPQIIKNLQEKGIQYRKISEALAQSKIKEAIEQPVSEPPMPPAREQPPTPIVSQQPPQQEIPQAPPPFGSPNPSANPQEQFPPQGAPGGNPEEIPGMQESILQSAPQPPQPGAQQEYIPTEGAQDYGAYQDPYQAYEPYATGGISPDTITEISEQVVAEKMMEMRKHVEKVTDFKTTMEAKTESIEERLRRLEETIHALQSSVLRKVGDYVTNVDDIKKELIATQQTFSKLVGTKHHTSHAHKTSHAKHHKTTHKKSSKRK